MSNYDYAKAKEEFRSDVDLILKNSSNEQLKYRKLTTDEAKKQAGILNKLFQGAKAGTYEKNSPIADLLTGKNCKIDENLPDGTKLELEIKSDEVQALQKEIKLYFKGDEVNEHTDSKILTTIRNFYLIKYGEKIPQNDIPAEYQVKGGFYRYQTFLEKECYHLICRFPSKDYLDNNQKPRSKPLDTMFYDAYFPKLALPYKNKGKISSHEDYQSHGYRSFVKKEALINQSELEDLYKSIFRSHLKVAAKNNELYSVVIPNAFFGAFDKNLPEKEKAKVIFTESLVAVVEEIKDDINLNKDSSDYAGFKGVLVGGSNPDEEPAKIIENAYKDKELLISNNPLYVSALDDLSNKPRTIAQPIMSEPFHFIGNGAWSNQALSAKDERDMRHSLGLNAVMASPYYNPELRKILEFNSSSFFDGSSRNNDESYLRNSMSGFPTGGTGQQLVNPGPFDRDLGTFNTNDLLNWSEKFPAV